jgi:hypothetical protein
VEANEGLKQAQACLDCGQYVIIIVPGVGFYTVGLPVNCIYLNPEADNDTLNNYAQFFGYLEQYLTLANDGKPPKRLIVTTDEVANGTDDNAPSARFLLRAVELKEPWRYLAVQSELALEASNHLMQLHEPDPNNRVFGEEGYTAPSYGVLKFEDNLDIFY